MKRLLSTFAVAVLALNLIVYPALAADNSNIYTIFYEDGSYAVVSLNANSAARSATDGESFYTYYNPLGQRCFMYGIYGTFTYNGVTSRAESCQGGITIYRQGWNISTHSEYVSGNTAYGRATFTGPNGESRAASLTLTCDKNGNVT